MLAERTTAQLRITMLLIVLGAMAGALASVPMTILGKFLSGAPAADIGHYLWNLRAFATIGAVVGPILGWGAMRAVPLWRAALEPTAAGVLGAVAGFMIGSDAGFLFGSIAGVTLATARLHLATRGHPALAAAPPGEGPRLPR